MSDVKDKKKSVKSSSYKRKENTPPVDETSLEIVSLKSFFKNLNIQGLTYADNLSTSRIVLLDSFTGVDAI